jgi:NAD-reducing hydrogenase large subunit
MKHPELAKMAILMRKYGQEVIKATAGKKIHGTGAIPGGINKNLSIQERDELKKDIGQMLQWAADGLGLFKKLYREDIKRMSSFAAFDSNHLGIVAADGRFDLYDGNLRAKEADGKIIFDQVKPADYLQVIREEVRPWSYMKFPFIKQLGPEKGWYRVGPLARVNICDYMNAPLAEKERQEFVKLGGGRMVNSTMAYHWARLIELLYSAEKIQELLKDKDLQGSELVREGKHRGEGIGIVEAPRGTLFHHYRVSETDQVTMANLIVSTTSNNEPMNQAVESVARNFLQGREITEGLLNHVEVAIRAYDPCLSCATHAVGRMPLAVRLEGADGALIEERLRG